MSKKAKYKAEIDTEGYFLVSVVKRGKKKICETDTPAMARRIARALNAMESKKPSRNSLQWRLTK